MMGLTLFPCSDYRWAYAAFTAFVLLLLALDRGVFHRQGHEVSLRAAATWSAVWSTLALGFNVLLYLEYLRHFGPTFALFFVGRCGGQISLAEIRLSLSADLCWLEDGLVE